ncbi:MAG: hypothetical protein PGN11_18820 [Quadrisphaera sp.]
MRRALPALATTATAAAAGLLGAGALVLPAWADDLGVTSAAGPAAPPAAETVDDDAPTALLSGTLRVLADVDHVSAGSLETARRQAAASLGGAMGPASGPDRRSTPWPRTCRWGACGCRCGPAPSPTWPPGAR